MWKVLLGGGGFRVRVHQPPKATFFGFFGGWFTRFDSVITSIGKVVALSKCVRVEIGWHQKSPSAVTASLETRPTMDGEPER